MLIPLSPLPEKYLRAQTYELFGFTIHTSYSSSYLITTLSRLIYDTVAREDSFAYRIFLRFALNFIIALLLYRCIFLL